MPLVRNLGRRFACLTYHMIGRSQYILNESQFHVQVTLFEAAEYVAGDFEALETTLHSRKDFPIVM